MINRLRVGLAVVVAGPLVVTGAVLIMGGWLFASLVAGDL